MATVLLTSMFLVAIPIIPTSASPAVINVPADYSTIQYAVGNASSGDTIIVAAGTYAGAIVDKNVTISGASGGASIITSGVPYKAGSSLYTAFRLDATADGAEIRDFTINCNSSEGFYFAIFSRNADNVTVDSLAVNDAVQGISNWGGSNWEITNNVLNDTEAAGGGGIAIFLGAYPPSYTVCSGNLIENNTITATATAPDYTCPGISVSLDLRYGAYDDLTGNEDVSNNQILNNSITAPGALNGVGIETGVIGLEGNATKIAAVLGTVHDNTIRDNTIDGADMGIYFYTVTNLAIQQNEIKNCNEGIHIKDGSDGNTINYNNIFGNAMGLNNTAEELVDATLNYWGDSSGPSGVGPGTGDAISDNVTYCPWLGYPFGTTPMTYHVNPTGTVQEAIDEASSGDTIVVHEGTYVENVNVNKPLTLEAASRPVIDGGAAGDCFSISANNVVISGFEIRNGYNGIGGQTSGSTFSNNIIHDNLNIPGSAGIGILLWGDNDNNNITGNEIYDNDRQGIFIGYQDDSKISTGNVIENNVVYNNGLYRYANGPDASAYGIQLWCADDNVIQANEVYGHDDWFPYGGTFDFAQGIYLCDSNDNNVMNNYLHDNNYGVGLWHPSRAVGNNYINYNNIVNNTGYGVRTHDSSPPVDARYNYWGHSSGPGPVGPGEGDKVSGNVDFEPWLSCYTPYTTTILYIDPPTIDKQAIEECTTFEVEVVIANVTDLYGFDLKLTWNDALLDLTAVEYQTNLNRIWTDWDVAMNETGAGWYRLVAHERTAEEGYTGDATLVNLTFHIKYGPCYIEENYQLSTLIHFALVKLSDSNSTPICTKVQDAKYTVHAVKPKLEIKPSEINISKFHETITVEVWLLNAMKVYDYAFNITYDTEILDAVNVEWGDFLPGPYYHKFWHIDETNGVIEISLGETAEAPPAKGDGLLVTITFHHKIIVWKDCPEWDNLLNCTIEFDWWKLSVRCPEPQEITGDLIDINNAEYSYIPIQGDVNSDGEVDVFDLRIVAAYYDQSQPEKCDLNCDGIIDIFDLVYVATNFGFSGDC